MPKTPSSPAISKPVRIVEPTLTAKIDDTKIEVLCKALRMGNTNRNACALAGINYDLFRRWMALGGFPLSGTKERDVTSVEDAEEPYYSFAVNVTLARAQAEQRAVDQVIAAGDKDWRAAAWMLEKSNPDDWAPEKKQSSVNISGSGVQIFLPDNGRGDVKEKEIIEGQVVEHK